MKVLGLMLASNNSEGNRSYKDMVQTCKRTWWKSCPENFSMFSVYADSYEGKESLNKLKNGECELIGQDIVANIPESRENIFQKTILGLEFLSNNYDFDYLFRPNCGSYINLNSLDSYLKNKPTSGYYDGMKVQLGPENFASGSCMIFSRDVVELLVRDMKSISYTVMDDVTIAFHLKKSNILVYNLEDFPAIQTHNESSLINSFDKNICQYHFCHSIDPNLILKCHELTVS